jgi:hypothetical protein
MLVCWKKASNQQRHQGAFPPADFASESSGDRLSSQFAPEFSCLNVSPFNKKGKLDKKDPTDNPSHYLADTCCVILLPPPKLGTSSLWCRKVNSSAPSEKSRWCDLHQVKLRPETDQQLQGG